MTGEARRDRRGWRRIADRLAAWFATAARPLPWRRQPRDPYHALVSEAMLQQTQASRAAEAFELFVTRFPTLASLAAAEEQDVLALWSGLGYYRRARSLHAAARRIASEHDGCVPADVGTLRSLPGVGPYTAGAIASIAHGVAAPAVDANVRRILARLAADERAVDDPNLERAAWTDAAALVEAAADPAVLNEALMELGATICTPRAPRCDACPLRASCAAAREGSAGRIPRPRTRAPRRVVHHAAVLVAGPGESLLVEQRADRGLWARLWQAPTVERDDAEPTAGEVAELTGAGGVRRMGGFTHATTHRLVHFSVWTSPAPSGPPSRGTYLPRARIAELPLATPHRRILLDHDAFGAPAVLVPPR